MSYANTSNVPALDDGKGQVWTTLRGTRRHASWCFHVAWAGSVWRIKAPRDMLPCRVCAT